MLFCGIGVRFPEIIDNENKQTKKTGYVPYVRNRHKWHFMDKIVRDVKKLFMPNCILCDAILWNRSQISSNHR